VNRAVGLLFTNTNLSKDNLITTSTFAQSKLELPRTPVLISKQDPKLPSSKEAKEGAEQMQNYLQSQIAY
jgi:hypothetical protein